MVVLLIHNLKTIKMAYNNLCIIYNLACRRLKLVVTEKKCDSFCPVFLNIRGAFNKFVKLKISFFIFVQCRPLSAE